MNPSSTTRRHLPPPVLDVSRRELAPSNVERGLTADDVERIVRRLELISHLFDNAYRIPGTSIRLGWDAVIGMVPVVGDALTTGVSAYFIWEANRLGARRSTLLKMIGNVAIDFGVGTVPLVGDLIDVTWRANRRNLRALVRELQHLGKLPKSLTPAQIDRLLGRRDRPHAQPSPPHRRSFFPLIMP